MEAIKAIKGGNRINDTKSSSTGFANRILWNLAECCINVRFFSFHRIFGKYLGKTLKRSE